MATTANISNLLQEFYEQDTIQTFSDEFWAHDEIQTAKNLRWDGNQVKIHIHTGRNAGVAAANESGLTGGTLPVAGHQKTQQGQISRKYVYGRISLTGPAIYSAQSSKNAFMDVLDFEMERLTRDVISARSFHLYTGASMAGGVGFNGIRAKVQGITGAGTVASPHVVTLEHAGGFDSTTLSENRVVPDKGATRYLRVGDPVVFGSLAQLASGTSGMAKGVVKSIERGLETIELDPDLTVGAGSLSDTMGGAPAYVARGYDEVGNNEANLCPTGLGLLLNFSAGQSFQGINYAGEDWAPTVRSRFATAAEAAASSGAITAGDSQSLRLADMHKVIQNIREISGQKTDLMVAHPSMINEYLNLIETTGNIQYQPLKATAGYDTLTFSSGSPIKWIFDNDCPYGAIFFLNKKGLMWAVNRPWGWEKTDGAVLRSIANRDEFTDRYVSYYDLGFKQLNSQGVLKGVQTSSTHF